MALRPVRPQVVALPVYGAAAAVLAGFYFLHYPIPGFWTRAAQVGAALAGVLLCAGLGARLWRLLGLPRAADPSEAFLFSVGAGLPALALSLLALGTAGFFRPGPIAVFLAAAGVFSGAELVRMWRERREILDPWTAGWGRAAGGLAVFALALTVLCAFAPPTYYDSLVYHLALPAKYLQEGRVGFVPYNQYAHFPQNMEMLYGAFLATAGDVAANLFNVCLGTLAVLAAAGLGRRQAAGGVRWDLILLVTAPCLLLLSSETYVEVPMAFGTTLALAAAVKAMESGDRRWWWAAGVFGGFLAGTKYTGAMTPALLGVLALAWPRRAPARERLKDFAAVGGTSFLLFLPWLAKNAVLTGGNPVFPFLPTVFPAQNVEMPVASARAYFSVLDEYRGSSGLLTELFLMPFRLATNATSFGGGYDVTGDLGWALPMILLPLSLGPARRDARVRFLLAYVAAHALLWGAMRPVLRFLVPLFPAVCVLSGAGFSRLTSGWPAAGRRAAAAAASLFLISNGILFYIVESVRDPFPEALGLVSREQYLRRKLDHHPAMAWMGEHLPAESRVFIAGDQRGYYCPRAYLAPMALLPSPLKGWADGASGGEGLRRKLLESGFTHLFFNRVEAERIKGYSAMEMTPAGKRSWEDFLLHGKEIYRDGFVSLYDLGD